MSDVPGEAVVRFVVQLVAGDVDLLGVDHDDVVAGVDVRGVDRLVLAAQAVREFGAEAAEGLAGGVDDVPVALDGLVLGGEGFHGDFDRSEEHTSELQSLMRRSYADFCLKKQTYLNMRS